MVPILQKPRARMAAPTFTIRPTSQCLRNTARRRSSFVYPRRTFTSTVSRKLEVEPASSPSKPPQLPRPPLDPNTVSTFREERILNRIQHVHPIGSRRRRAALQSSDNVPFEQMPYQCFQEARKVLAADREEKVQQIAEMRKRIAHWQAIPAAAMGGEYVKKGKLVRMQKHLEDLKVLADINDPVIKKRFEDGQGDMNRPIYRYLGDRKWREYKRKVLMQRISQHHIVPDLLPHLDPTAEVSLAFGRRNIQPGEFVDSRISEQPAKLTIQAFDKGERLVSIAVVDPDVPNAEKDGFDSRCHFLAVNVPLSPTSTSLPLLSLKKKEHIIQPWLRPFGHKGAPYERFVIFVMQQDGGALNLEALREGKGTRREWWSARWWMAQQKDMRPIGVHIFRTQWDDGTDGVVKRHKIEGGGVEFVRKKPEKLPYKKKDGARYR